MSGAVAWTENYSKNDGLGERRNETYELCVTTMVTQSRDTEKQAELRTELTTN